MNEYNGHRSWNAWNIALWIGNTESIYRCAVDVCLADRKLYQAVNKFMSVYGGTRTPDGAIYNRLSVKLALEELIEACTPIPVDVNKSLRNPYTINPSGEVRIV